MKKVKKRQKRQKRHQKLESPIGEFNIEKFPKMGINFSVFVFF